MAASGATLHVKDYRKFMSRCRTPTRHARVARAEIRHAGDQVKTDAAAAVRQYDPRSAAGYRIVVRQRGVAVEQSIRKTTGNGPTSGRCRCGGRWCPHWTRTRTRPARRSRQALDTIATRFNALMARSSD